MYKYTVITASDGAEGVARFAEYRDAIALVLTDMMMPVMDGQSLNYYLTEDESRD